MLSLGLGLGLELGLGLGLGLGFYVTNSDRRVTVGDRVIFTNHIPVPRILVFTFPILILSQKNAPKMQHFCRRTPPRKFSIY